jgi:hypothetical protein
VFKTLAVVAIRASSGTTLGVFEVDLLLLGTFEVLRLILYRFCEGSGVLLRGNSGSFMISLLLPWLFDIVFEMLC